MCNVDYADFAFRIRRYPPEMMFELAFMRCAQWRARDGYGAEHGIFKFIKWEELETKDFYVKDIKKRNGGLTMDEEGSNDE